MSEGEIGLDDLKELARTGTVEQFRQLLNDYGAIGAVDENGNSVADGFNGRDYLAQALSGAGVVAKADKQLALTEYDYSRDNPDTNATQKDVSGKTAPETTGGDAEENKAVLAVVAELKEELKTLKSSFEEALRKQDEAVRDDFTKIVQEQHDKIEILTASVTNLVELIQEQPAPAPAKKGPPAPGLPNI